MLPDLKVFFRALELDDYKTSIDWRQDPEIWKMVVGRRYFVSEEAEKQWVAKAGSSPTDLKFAICDKKTEAYIGNIYLGDIDFFNKSATFSKLIGNKKYWGGGFGTHATLLMLHHAFFDLGLERIEARQLIENKASIRVNEKCGFKNEGILRKSAFKNGKLQDINLMSVIREDFEDTLKSYSVKES